jgi:hypothetical protein
LVSLRPLVCLHAIDRKELPDQHQRRHALFHVGC